MKEPVGSSLRYLSKSRPWSKSVAIYTDYRALCNGQKKDVQLVVFPSPNEEITSDRWDFDWIFSNVIDPPSHDEWSQYPSGRVSNSFQFSSFDHLTDWNWVTLDVVDWASSSYCCFFVPSLSLSLLPFIRIDESIDWLASLFSFSQFQLLALTHTLRHW